MFENELLPLVVIIVCLVSMVGLTIMILHGLWKDHKDRRWTDDRGGW